MTKVVGVFVFVVGSIVASWTFIGMNLFPSPP